MEVHPIESALVHEEAVPDAFQVCAQQAERVARFGGAAFAETSLRERVLCVCLGLVNLVQQRPQ